MSERPTNDPFEIFQISKEILSAEQKYLPTGKVFAQFAEIMRNITQAQITYSQALMRANAALLAAFLERPLATTTEEKKEERPSVAARRSDVSAP